MASCGDQAFRVDERVSILAPDDRAVVELPVTLRWRAEGLDDRTFGIFVDRAPVRPGRQVVESVNRTDAVYTTSDTELVISEVYDDQAEGRERHTATIVLVDPAGRRVGESAWDVTFEVDRQEEQP